MDWLKLFSQWRAFDCSLCHWPGDSNISAEPHWRGGRFCSYALTMMCFFSWITAFHRELHQLLDLMDLTLTQGLRQSRRKILKRFDSVGHVISAAKYGGPVDFIEGGTQAVSNDQNIKDT